MTRTGIVNIWTDDYADKGHLVNIVWHLLESEDGQDPQIQIKKIQLLLNTSRDIATAALFKESGVNPSNPYLNYEQLVHRELEGIRSVYREVERLRGLKKTEYGDLVKAGKIWYQGED